MLNLVRQVLATLPKSIRRNLLPLLLTIRVAGLGLAALALWVFAKIADEILEKESYAFDQEILLAIRRIHSPVLDRIMLGLTFLGEPMTLLILVLGIGLWLLRKQHRSQATTLAIAALGGVGLNFILKQVFRRARPLLWERLIDINTYSFPSGHAMVSLVVLGTIGYILAVNFQRFRYWIFGVTLLLILGIGFSRLYLGVHWPTDIIAGYAAGFVWLVTCIFSMELWGKRPHNS